MKYIGNAFSPAMFRDKDITLTIKTITESQFMKARNHSKSIIGHPELAEHFDLPLNRETIHLKKGDQLYIALPRRRYKENKTIHYGDTTHYDVENTDFLYKLVQVLEK